MYRYELMKSCPCGDVVSWVRYLWPPRPYEKVRWLALYCLVCLRLFCEIGEFSQYSLSLRIYSLIYSLKGWGRIFTTLLSESFPVCLFSCLFWILAHHSHSTPASPHSWPLLQALPDFGLSCVGNQMWFREGNREKKNKKNSNILKCLPSARPYFLHAFTYISLHNPYNNSVRRILLSFSFHRRRWGTERLSAFPKVTQLVTEATKLYYLIKSEEKQLHGDWKCERERERTDYLGTKVKGCQDIRSGARPSADKVQWCNSTGGLFKWSKGQGQWCCESQGSEALWVAASVWEVGGGPPGACEQRADLEWCALQAVT